MDGSDKPQYPKCRMSDAADGQLVIVAGEGVFIWVRPRTVRGEAVKGKVRVLCQIRATQSHSRRILEAVRVMGSKRREELSAREGIVISDPVSLGMPSQVSRYRDCFNGSLGLLYELDDPYDLS